MALILNALGLVQAAFKDPGSSFDLCRASLLSVFGFWLLQPNWAHRRYPNIAADMASLAPVWIWGLVFVAVGGLTFYSVVKRMYSLLVMSYVLSFFLWMTVGWLFCVRSAPPPVEGVMAPIIAAFIANRVLHQLPSNRGGYKTCAHKS